MLKIQPNHKQFQYPFEMLDDFEVESVDTEDYADVERIVRDSSWLFVDDDDPLDPEFDADFDMDTEGGFEDDEA